MPGPICGGERRSGQTPAWQQRQVYTGEWGVLVSHKSKCLGVPVRRGGQGGLAGQTAMVPLHPEQLLTYFFYVFETPSDCISKMDIIIKIKG